MTSIENDKIRVVFSEKGLVTSLRNKMTSHEYTTHIGDTWRIFLYEGKPGAPHIKEPYCWEIPVFSKEQKPIITKDGSTVTVLYDKLTCAKLEEGKSSLNSAGAMYAEYAGLTDMNIKLTFTITLREDEIIWKAAIANYEERPHIGVGEIWFPMVSGVTWLSPEEDDYLILPDHGGRKVMKPLERMTERAVTGLSIPRFKSLYTTRTRRIAFLYPGRASMQWYALCNPREGLYMGSHDKSLQSTCLLINSEDYGRKKALNLSFAKYPFVETGANWESAEFIVSAYFGDWHVAAKKYRLWADTWMVKPKPPEWVRKMPGWASISLKGQNGQIRYKYEDLPKMFEEATLAGVNTLFVWGWWTSGHDRGYPDNIYELDPRLGTEEDLQKAQKQIRDAGGNIFFYNQGRMIDRLTDWYKEGGSKATMKTIYGFEYNDLWTFASFGTMYYLGTQNWMTFACPSTEAWSDIILRYAKRMRDLGSSAVFYDYWCHKEPYLCFDPSHGHQPSMAYGPGVIKCLKRVKDEFKNDSEYAVITEAGNDAAGQYLDFVQGAGQCGYTVHSASSEGEDYPEVFRYTFPDRVVSSRMIAPGDYEDTNFSFIYGYRLGLNLGFAFKDMLKFKAYCRRLCEIRNMHKSLLLEGTFVDNEGFIIDNSRLIAKAFRKGDDEYAVLVWNRSDKNERFNVTVPGFRLNSAHTMKKSFKEAPKNIGSQRVITLIYGK